ncbi:MAG TPA: hypothetical protein VKX24_04905 [Acidimicrobiia bacterium]|nr:hypothetical protein [Acidimicrobiia bacterium]
MQDLVFIAVIVGFFGVLWLLIGAFDRIIGSDEEALGHPAGEPGPAEPTGPTEPEEQAA